MNGREAEVPRNAADDDAAHDTPSCIASLRAMLSQHTRDRDKQHFILCADSTIK